jgi:hypothetical protein
MARLIERVFDPSKPLIVRRFFAGAGRHWNPGDDFPWRRLAVDARRVRLMFEAGKLMHADEGGRVGPKGFEPPAIGPALTAEEQTASIAQEMQDEDIHHIAVTSTPVYDDGLEDMKMQDLRAIAEAEGAPTRLRRQDQIDVIRENRAAGIPE